jgi:hypothetical protein
MPRLSEWYLPFGFSNQNFIHIFHLPMHATCPNHLNILDLISLLISVKCTSYKAAHYALFAGFLTLPHSCVQIILHDMSLILKLPMSL